MSETESRDPRRHLPLHPNDFEILLSLNDSEKHGYRIIRDIEQRTEGTIKLGTSTLYAVIRRLLAAGILEDAGDKALQASGGPPRRYYRISELGRELLRLEALRLQEVAAAARERILETEAGA
jgi:DNA-binding PadR family transcriptional regulator